MRKGPHPLPVHMGMIAANMKGVEEFSHQFKSRIDEADAVQMMRGIQLYQSHPYQPPILPTQKIWSAHGASVLKPLGVDSSKRGHHVGVPLLLVPSLINKSNILDLTEQVSMLRWLHAQGHDVYLLDWGDLQSDAVMAFNIEDLISNILSKAIQSVAEMHGSKVNVLGYCMGGTLLMGAAPLVQDHLNALVLLATPWDFHAKSSVLARNVRLWSPSVVPVVKERGVLPAQWAQALFASLHPEGAAHKFMRFASMDQSSSEAELFVSVEDWLNDGVHIPKNIAHDCIQDWFIENKTAQHLWSVNGQIINPSDLGCPAYVVASHKDRLVSYDTAMNLLKDLPAATSSGVSLECGHVGLIVGRHAVRDVWSPIHQWLSSLQVK